MTLSLRNPARLALLAVSLVVGVGCGGSPDASDSSGTGSGGAGGSEETAGTGGQTSTVTTGGATTTSSGVGTTSASSSATTGGGSTDPSQLCVDSINAFRATLKLPPYARWNQEEACADDQATKDAASGKLHGAFGQCTESAQDECPAWAGPPEVMIGKCMKLMWDEGPGDFNQGHGHYINMSSTQYTKVACGFHVLPDGHVWATQDFD